VTVRDVAGAPQGSVAGRDLRFYAVEGGWQAVAALPVELAPGAATVEIRAPAPLSARVEVVDPAFPETQLRVEPKYVTPSPAQKRRMEEDQAAFDAAWRQPFGPPAFGAAFLPPRRSAETGPFGERRLFNGEKRSQHHGVDLAGAVGEPVAASNDGVVLLARDCYASGRSLVLGHGGGLFSVYFHLDAFEVKPGDRVRRGQVVARVGQTGRVTGPHLHFGIKVGDRYVDPASVYRLSFGAPPAPRRGRRAGSAAAAGSRRRWCRPTGSRHHP
jgi:murein DD-endopeptidase MepM/ murein hydrolase activator NlpD